MGTITGSHYWENIILPGVKFSSQSTENRLQVDFGQPSETLRRKKILGKPFPKKRLKKISFTCHPDWLTPSTQEQLCSLEKATQEQLCSLEKATLEAEQRRLENLEERRKNYVWEDALARRAARRLQEKVERTKRAYREEGVTIPRELLNSLKAAKWRLF